MAERREFKGIVVPRTHKQFPVASKPYSYHLPRCPEVERHYFWLNNMELRDRDWDQAMVSSRPSQVYDAAGKDI